MAEGAKKGFVLGADTPALRPASDVSTFIESPSPRHSMASAHPRAEDGLVPEPSPGTARTRARKRMRPERIEGIEMLTRTAAGADRRTLNSAVLAPGFVMKVSTLATASGSVCMLFALFSGPVLVFLAISTLGVCGMCYSIRKRGALEYLPRGAVDLLTRTTLLEFLTDTSVFDAVKTYLVFMMGLSDQETEGVLRSLPEAMRDTLTRPGLMHTLPRGLQELLVPAPLNATERMLTEGARSSDEQQHRSHRRRRHGVSGTEAAEASTGGTGAATHALQRGRNPTNNQEGRPPLGQLVWNPLPPLRSSETRPAFRLGERQNPEEVSVGTRGDVIHVDAGHGDHDVIRVEGVDVGAGDEGDIRDIGRESDSGDEGGQPRLRGSSGVTGVGARRGRRDAADELSDERTSRHRAWFASLSRTRSLSPPEDTDRRRARSSADAGRTSGRLAPKLLSFTLPARRGSGPSRHEEDRRLSSDAAGAGPAAAGFVPSAEWIVASIIQKRMDNAVKAAWNMVDERVVRRAALGSAIALAAHVAISKNARHQASSMIRGSLLATLAGTTTVCASLVYLKPREASTPASDSTAEDIQSRIAAEAEAVGEASDVAGTARERGEDHAVESRLSKCRETAHRYLRALLRSRRNLLGLLGMILVLLAIRKWQVLKKAALNAAMRTRMYGSSLT